jgi:hypothetical protein
MDQMAAFRATYDRGDLGTSLSSEGFTGDPVAIGYIWEVRCGEAFRQLPDETRALPQENVNNLLTTVTTSTVAGSTQQQKQRRK